MAKDNYCIYCGFKLFPEDHFCPNCGKRLDEGPSTTVNTNFGTTTGNYTFYKNQLKNLKDTYENKEKKSVQKLKGHL